MARSGQIRKAWLKTSVVITCATLFPLGVIFSRGPGSDQSVAPRLFEKTLDIPTPPEPMKLYADAGYDAEWLHGLLRQEWEVESVIKPARTRADGTCGGRYRSEMTPEYLQSAHYGQRWQIESYFSALKRTMGSTLSARKELTQHLETAFRILAYSLRKWWG